MWIARRGKTGGAVINGNRQDPWIAAPGLSTALIAVLIACPMPVVVTDGAGLIIGWNDLASSLFGWRPRDILGLPMADFIVPPDMREKYRRHVEERSRATDGQIVNDVVYTEGWSSDDRAIPLEVSFASGVGYGQVFYIGFITDLTGQARPSGRGRWADLRNFLADFAGRRRSPQRPAAAPLA